MAQDAEARTSEPCCVGEPALPCRGECRRKIHVCRRGKARIGRSGRGAHIWFCLRTTFERILRDEVTTAAQVSSAEDSRARTVKCLKCRRAAARRGEGNSRRGRLIWAVSRCQWHYCRGHTTMFTEKLSSSTSSFARGPAQLLPGSRSHSQHSRATDSQLRENAGSPAPPIAPSTSSGGSSKVHTSPSKVRHCLRSLYLCTVSSSSRTSLLVAITCNEITLESSSLHTEPFTT